MLIETRRLLLGSYHIHKKLAMIFPSVNKMPAFLLEKLAILFQLLKEKKAEYEEFADRLTDKHLKRTVLTLAQETNQYAAELFSQIETMGGNTDQPAGLEPTATNRRELVNRDEILKSCEINEVKMIVAYRSVLNEPFLHPNLRKLIRCQLNGLTFACMQLRFLNTSL